MSPASQWSFTPVHSQQVEPALAALGAVKQRVLGLVEAHESAERDSLFAALCHVFPYSLYRDQRPDLASLSDQDLVVHFAAHGIHEGCNLSSIAVEAELQQLRANLEDANAKADLCEQKSAHTAAQLDLLKEMFVKLSVQH